LSNKTGNKQTGTELLSVLTKRLKSRPSNTCLGQISLGDGSSSIG
jgi:hypothetical protein